MRIPREGSWQRAQRERREAYLGQPQPEPNVARDPRTRKTQRDAFIQGCSYIRRQYSLYNTTSAVDDYREAERRFPKELKVRRPRVVRFAHGPDIPGVDVAFRYRAGYFESQDVLVGAAPIATQWVVRSQLPAAWIDLLLELKRNPMEEVPA